MRIASLLPSATEIICGLGLRDQLVGVTHECDYPLGVSDLPKVTKTLIPHDAASGEIDILVRERLKTERALYSLDMPALKSLAPDLIVTQALCDVCAVSESEVNEAARSLPSSPIVINLEPSSLAEVFDCVLQVAKAANCVDRAEHHLAGLKDRVQQVEVRSQSIVQRPKVMMLEWIDPPFNAGHWSPELVRIAGGREAVGVAGKRSVTTPWESIIEADPEFMMIACCGFDVARTLQDIPLLKSYPDWKSLACVRSGNVFVVDGSAYFSRPGPRLVDSIEILAHAMHPNVHPLPTGLPPAVLVQE